MKHYGDITKISGATASPVNVIIGGSPCQDLSVAGKQKGIKHADNDDSETTRSGLFMEQLRVIKEMRRNDADSGRTGIYIRPRYMVWENVPGAFSSNKGADFATVLEETVKVVCEKVPVIPVPKHGWPNAGCLSDVAGKWSVAWRVFDAQFWGVPQRRKRIALVADFGGLTAPEILFERESVCGDIEPSRPAGESFTAEAEGGIGAAVGAFCIQGNAIDRSDTAGCNGRGWADGVSYTLNTVDRPAVAVIPIDLRNATRSTPSGDSCGVGIGDIGDPAFTVTTDYSHAIAVEHSPAASHVVFDGEAVTSKTNASNPQVGDACHTLGASGASRALLVHVLEHHPQDSRIKINENGVVQTLAGNMGMGGNNVPLVMESSDNSKPITEQPPPILTATCGSFTQTGEGVSCTLLARDYKDPQIVCYPQVKEAHHDL